MNDAARAFAEYRMKRAQEHPTMPLAKILRS
jgi:hypothetical protein